MRSNRIVLFGAIALVGMASLFAGLVALRSPEARKTRYWHRAEAYLKAGKYPEAAIALENVVRIDPQFAQGYLKLGLTYLSLRNPRRALDNFTKAAEIDHNLVEAQFRLGELYFLSGQYEKARERAQLVVLKAPSNGSAWILLAQSYAGLRKWGQAVETVEALLQRDPKAPGAHVLLGSLLLQVGKSQDAIDQYQLAISLAPKAPSAYYSLGVAYKGLKKDAQAIDAFEKALSLNPGMEDALAQEASIYWGGGNPAKAIARVREQITRSPKTAQFQDLLGIMYLLTGDTTEAQQRFAQAIQVNPNLPASYLLLGRTYADNKLYELASKKFEEALRVDPNNVMAYMQLGIAQDLLGHFDEAKRHYERAIALNPSLVPALNNLAWYYAEDKGDLTRAQQYATRALVRAPDDPYTLDTQGWIYYKQGRYDEAVQYIARSAKTLAKHPLIHYHLGMAYLHDGHEELAKKELRKALNLSQDFPGSDEAQKALRILP